MDEDHLTKSREGPHPIQATSDRRPPTLGEYRVGISFNPSGNEHVDTITIKTICTHLIDYLDGLRPHHPNSEENRLFSLAQTHIEDAAMWAVKAVTKPPR